VDLDRDVEFLVGLVAELVERHHPPHESAAVTGMSVGTRMSRGFAAVAATRCSSVERAHAADD
jgi:poly(3-hydroxybutyrate) depolymerase